MKKAFSYTLIGIVIFILPTCLLLYFLRLYYGLDINSNATDIISIVETMPLFNSLGIWQKELTTVYEAIGHAISLMETYFDNLFVAFPFGALFDTVVIIVDFIAAFAYAVKALILYVWYLLGDILLLLKWVLEIITLYIG